MKHYGPTRNLGWSMREYSVVREGSFRRLQILGTRKSNFTNNMANGGHQLLGLQFSSHLSDFMPSCVRAAHNGDANEFSSQNPNSEVPQKIPPPADLQPAAVSSSTRAGLLSFASLRSRFGTANDSFLADVSVLDRHTDSSSMAASGSPPEIMMNSYDFSARAAKHIKEDALMDSGQGHQFYFASSTMFPDQTESEEQHDQADDEQANQNNNKMGHEGGSRLMMETLQLPHSMWVPSFNFSNSDVEMMGRVDNVANDRHSLTLESPPSCAGEDIYCGVMSKEYQVTSENTYNHTARSHSHGFRSKISSILSLEKRGTLATSPHILGRANSCAKNDNMCSRRASRAAESRVCESSKGSCFGAHRFADGCGEVNKNGFRGECSGRSSPSGAWNYGNFHGSRPDGSCMDSSESGGGWCSSNSGDSHWHFEQRNVLMRTLHKMRCDIESLKMMLRALENPVARNFPFDPHRPETLGYPSSLHPLMMSGSAPAASEMKQRFCPPFTSDGPSENRLNDPKADNEVAAQNASDNNDLQVNYNNSYNNSNSNDNDRDLMSSEEQPASGKDSDDADNSGPNYNRKSTHGGTKKQKQWWRELLTALGLTVWVLAGAALVAKVIGVPNLGVTNIAHNKSWGSSDDESNSSSVKGSTGVIELNSYTFNDAIKKRTTFVMFYAPWCPHCQRLHPIWSQLASVLARNQKNIQMAIVDATRHTRLADKYDVPGFPTLILFKNGVPVGRHRGARDLDTLLAFIASNT